MPVLLEGSTTRREEMNVGELITMLSEFDPDFMVVVDGYEYGLTEPENPREIKVNLDENKGQQYCGPHEEISYRNSHNPETRVVYLER